MRLSVLARFSPTVSIVVLPWRHRKHAGCVSAVASFSATTAGSSGPTYYEILNVPVTASMADIKKYVHTYTHTYKHASIHLSETRYRDR